MRTTGRCAVIVAVLGVAAGLNAGEIRFKKTVVDKAFRSEGVAVGDVNRDGKKDILAGPLWYEAPDWKPHEISPKKEWKPKGEYSESFIDGAMDVNGDGWVDFLVIDQPGVPCHWFENPQNKEGHWTKHVLFRDACNESPLFVDLFGGGRLVGVWAVQPEAQMAWFSPPANVEGPWEMHPISEKKSPGTEKYAHGLGVGDINRDGRNDVVIKEGWWEQPADPKAANWAFHPATLGPPAAHMIVFDVDADGDMDVISSSAHAYGIWWHEQAKDAAGNVAWKQHDILTTISQTHALILVDMNGDGLPDLVTGKRYYAHHGNDPGAEEPAYLFWLEFSRKDGKPQWTFREIDNNSGAGTQFVVEDMNGDKRPDVVTSNKKGTHCFEQE